MNVYTDKIYLSHFSTGGVGQYSMRLYRQTEFMPHLPISLSSVNIVDDSEIV